MPLLRKLSDLQPSERAHFATLARLLSCLVTESLVSAFYRPLPKAEAVGFAIVVGSVDSTSFNLDDVIVLVPLHHPPVFKHEGDGSLGRAIGLLDPMDMLPVTFEIRRAESAVDVNHGELASAILTALRVNGGIQLEKNILHPSSDPLSLWTKFAESYKLDKAVEEDIGGEFLSAIKWQTYSYQNPMEAPLFSSPSIAWEQSIVEGHPTHPMHKLRRFLPPLPDFDPGAYDMLYPKLRFVSVPRNDTKITFEFENLVSPLLEAASQAAAKQLEVPEGHVVIPVHELQTVHIKAKFPDAIVYPEEFQLPLLAQQSLRSVIIPGGFNGLHLKLAIGVKLTSAVRTISPESAYLGPRFSAQVVPALTMNRDIVTVARELASIVHANPNGEIAKHCAALIRECHEDGSEERGERLIVCTSLVERGHAGKDGNLPSVVRVFELDTEEKRLQWFAKFVSIFLKAFLPPMIHNGVAFECHPQNCVARFDLHTKELKGFIIRDFGGLRVHPETLKATTGVDLDFMTGHSIVADTLDDVYTRMYHTIIHNHFQQLIRVLDLHYNGLGWAVVRDQLRDNIPIDHPLYDAWLSPNRKTLPGKCFMRMRMTSMYRFHLHGPFPNLIHYTGCEEEGSDGPA